MRMTPSGTVELAEGPLGGEATVTNPMTEYTWR